MTLSETELQNILSGNQPLLDASTREVFRHLLKRIENLEETVNQLTTEEPRANKEELRALLDNHIEHHSVKRNGARAVTREEKPLVDILRVVIDALPA